MTPLCRRPIGWPTALLAGLALTLLLGAASSAFAQAGGSIAGVAWNDRNRNGKSDGREPGIADVSIQVLSPEGTLVATGTTDRGGKFDIPVSGLPAGGRGYTIEVTPPAGFHASTPSVIRGVPLTAGDKDRLAFGLTAYRTITLAAARVHALTHCDLMEKDWGGSARGAHRDQDLVIGADAAGTDQLSVWFNRYDNTMLFNSARDYARTTPNSVLALAADALTQDPTPFADRPDLVAGTRLSGAGNVFVWFNQNTSGNEGYVRTTYSLAYETLDRGDVHAVLTGNVAGGPGIDWVAGTKASPGRGSIEIWASDDAAMPTYSRVQVLTTVDGAGTQLGEVSAMTLTHLKPGETDLVVGTRTGEARGQVVVFRRRSDSGSFEPVFVRDVTGGSVTSLTVCDLTRDGAPDVVLGIRESGTSGRLDLWANAAGAEIGLAESGSSRLETGYPVSLASGDLGGDPGPDVVCGWRANDQVLAGGILVFQGDRRSLPARGVDPSGGAVKGMVTALTIADFDRGSSPASASPSGDDIAAGVTLSPTQGSIILFLR